MNTIETIRAEIERLKNEWASIEDELTDAMVAEYDYLLDFLDTLEERVPEIKETGTQVLDEAADKWVFDNCLDCDIVGEHRACESFKAGADWAFNQMKL